MRYLPLLTLGLLLLSPRLAHADALDGAYMMLQLLAAIWGLALLLMLLSLLAYWRPASRVLRGLNYAGIGLSLVLGLTGAIVIGSTGSGSLGLGADNPFLRLSLPFAAWLGGASWATFAATRLAREWAVAVAAAGAIPMVHFLLSMATSWLPPLALTFGAVGAGVSMLTRLLITAGTWWVVLRQAQRRQLLGWHDLRPVLLVPALAAGLLVIYAYLPFLGEMSLQWLRLILTSTFTSGLPGYAVGAAIIWLNQRRYRAEAFS
jgi:hypothetical protein